MMSQRGMLRVAQIKGWQIIRSNRGTLDLATGAWYAWFTFNENKTLQCRVAQSRIEKFKSLAAECFKS